METHLVLVDVDKVTPELFGWVNTLNRYSIAIIESNQHAPKINGNSITLKMNYLSRMFGAGVHVLARDAIWDFVKRENVTDIWFSDYLSVDLKKYLTGTVNHHHILPKPNIKKIPTNELEKRAQNKTRRHIFRELLNTNSIVRLMEVHDAMSGLIVENTLVQKPGEINCGFHGMWASSLTSSITQGKPDIEIVDLNTRIQSLISILNVTSKPIVFDADTGGKLEHFWHYVRALEKQDVSAVVIEDKKGLKRNSLYGREVVHYQEEKEAFCKKIKVGKCAQLTDDFMVIARVESFIVGTGLNDALDRAQAYIDAGADGIVIHSKANSPKEVLAFADKYGGVVNRAPLIVIPTTYPSITERDLTNAGVNVVIYANHLLRSAYPAMQKVARKVLENGSIESAEQYCAEVKDILDLIPLENHEGETTKC